MSKLEIPRKHLKVLQTQHPAFSLVEIAVVLVIVGLLIGAVLKGQDLLHNARLNTIITQINQYRLATTTFLDRYSALPGDYDMASKHIASHLKDGNSNGIIQGPGAASYTSGENHQATSFWAHLAAADLIPDPGTKEQSGSISPNHGFPATKLGGGFTVSHAPEKTMDGHWFIIGRQTGQNTKGGLFTPKDALAIMQKIDTPDPFSGSVQVRNGIGSGQSEGCLKAKTLNIENNQPACVLYIKM